LTNQPPTGGVALPPGVAAQGTAGQPAAANPAAPNANGTANVQTANAAPPPPDNTAKSQTRNYEIDRTLNYVKQPAGRLKRLTVAVLIDNVRTTGKDGKPIARPLGEEQLTRITQLVKDAVGFDEARGDSVNVVNSSFEGDVLKPEGDMESVPVWELPMVRDIAKLLAGVVVLLVLILSVLKPLMKGLITSSRTVLVPAGQTALAPAPAPAGGAAALPSANQAATPGIAYEQQLTQARTLVNQDPKRVAQVVRSWVAQDE
jgi:flagellar M-ring protein FliF